MWTKKVKAELVLWKCIFGCVYLLCAIKKVIWINRRKSLSLIIPKPKKCLKIHKKCVHEIHIFWLPRSLSTPLSFLSAAFVRVWYRRGGSHLLIKRLRQHSSFTWKKVEIYKNVISKQRSQRDYSKSKGTFYAPLFMRIKGFVVWGGTSIFIVYMLKSSKTECPIIIPFPFFYSLYLHVAISERRSKSINSLLVSQAESSWDNLV